MKASEAYFKGEFHTINIKPLDETTTEIVVYTWDGKKGRCVIKRNSDGSLEIIEDEEVS